MPRRSGRVIRPLVKLTLMGESSLTILESHEDDPTSYYKQINDKDFSFWKEVVKTELNLCILIMSGLLWIYPKGLNPLVVNGYKRNRGVYGKDET